MFSYVEKYVEFKNQSLKKSAGIQTGYMQKNTPGVTHITKYPQNEGTLYSASTLTYLATPEQFLMVAILFTGTF